MLTIAVVGALIAAGPARAEPPTLATLPLKTVGVSPELANFYGEHLAQRLRSAGFKVITSEDVAALLGLERQKQLLGCSDDASNCMAELANAMGAEVVLTGEVARLEDAFHLNLKILDTQKGETVAWYQGDASGEKAMLRRLDEAAVLLSGKVFAHVGYTAPAVAEEVRPLRAWSWAPAVGGLAFAGLGSYLMIEADKAHQQLTGPQTETALEDPVSIRDRGAQNQNLARASFGIAAAGLVAGATMFLWPAEERSVQTEVMVTGGSAYVGVTGVW